MNRSIVFIILFLVFLIGGYFLFPPKADEKKEGTVTGDRDLASQVETTPQDVDYKASFAIFTNGTFRIFTAAMYHNQSEEVFIEALSPNIVHVKKEGVTWNDFFATLPFSLDKDCLTTGTGQTFCSGSGGELRFFLNGTEDPDSLDKVIVEADKLLVTFGNLSNSQIQDQIAQIPIVE